MRGTRTTTIFVVMKDLLLHTKNAAWLVALMAVLATSAVQAYSVRYAAKVSPTGIINFEAPGYCAQEDTGHSMMPKLRSFQLAAAEVFTSNSFERAPIGGEARQSACLDERCEWQFNHGLHYRNELTFFYGVVRDTTLHGRPHETTYNNFADNFPIWWANVSYWGARQPYMRKDTEWANDNVVTYYTQWLCEYYEYHQSDAEIFPTYPDGEVIVPQSTDVYVHCGKGVERDLDGHWIYQRCKEPFPWWGGLIIAVVCLTVPLAAVTGVSCLCFYLKRRKVEREWMQKLETLADNPAQVPTQTQMGLGHSVGCTEDRQ